MSYEREEPLVEALQEAVELGIQAHDEDWHLDLVEFKYDELFDNKIEAYIERGRKRKMHFRNGQRRSQRLKELC